MHISVTDAKAQLTELLRRTEAGEEVVLTRHGKAVARIVPIARKQSREERMALLEALRGAAHTAIPGSSAARSQDFLYDENGLPA